MLPRSNSVVAALRDLGRWKLGTPLEIASTPVRAAQPEENARRTRKPPARPVRPCSQPAWVTTSSPADSACPSVPVSSWMRPTTAMMPMTPMYR